MPVKDLYGNVAGREGRIGCNFLLGHNRRPGEQEQEKRQGGKDLFQSKHFFPLTISQLGKAEYELAALGRNCFFIQNGIANSHNKPVFFAQAPRGPTGLKPEALLPEKNIQCEGYMQYGFIGTWGSGETCAPC
jgi:hypothetical protein